MRCDWSGYIGGTVLARLIQDPKRSEYDITVLLRSDGKAEGFKKFGLKTVKGSLDDVEILEKLVSEHDVVFQTVSPLRIVSSLCDVPMIDEECFGTFRLTLTTSKGPMQS